MKSSRERTLFAAPTLRIGAFRRYPWDPPFEDTGPTGGYLLVFPRTPVEIRHAGKAPVLADPTRVMLYNLGQEYTRRSVRGGGDECDYFAFAPALVVDALRESDPSVDDRHDRPFAVTHAPVDARSYLLQRRVVEHVQTASTPDRLFVEESAVRLLARVASASAPASTAAPSRAARRASTSRAHAELAEACRRALAVRLDEPMSLADVARAVATSPFHLARVFARETGETLHGHRRELRLRASLDRLAARDADLAAIALDLGFATHSHFTAEFRRLFGVTPSAFRAGCAPERAGS